MKKRILIALVVVLALAATASVVWAKGGGPTGVSGKSNVAHLYLHEKDPSDWSIVEDGAWGKMTYRRSHPTFKFVFNGHALEPGSTYELIYYPDPWPGTDLICFESGTANRGGNVHIQGSVETDTDLPIAADDNAEAKIWLVLSDDVDCEDSTQMIDWNPTEYLFEYDLINYDDTDVP